MRHSHVPACLTEKTLTDVWYNDAQVYAPIVSCSLLLAWPHLKTWGIECSLECHCLNNAFRITHQINSSSKTELLENALSSGETLKTSFSCFTLEGTHFGHITFENTLQSVYFENFALIRCTEDGKHFIHFWRNLRKQNAFSQFQIYLD